MILSACRLNLIFHKAYFDIVRRIILSIECGNITYIRLIISKLHFQRKRHCFHDALSVSVVCVCIALVDICQSLVTVIR